MRSILSALTCGALLTISSAMLVAGEAPDPAIGSWKLNPAKSTGALVPKSETRTYAASAEGTALTFKRVGADGKEITVHSTFKYDGKDYPATGSPDFDSLNVKRVGPSLFEGAQKRAGKVVGTTRRTVSKDGKTLTLVSRRPDATGRMTTTTLVFDRQ